MWSETIGRMIEPRQCHDRRGSDLSETYENKILQVRVLPSPPDFSEIANMTDGELIESLTDDILLLTEERDEYRDEYRDERNKYRDECDLLNGYFDEMFYQLERALPEDVPDKVTELIASHDVAVSDSLEAEQALEEAVKEHDDIVTDLKAAMKELEDRNEELEILNQDMLESWLTH